MSKTPFLWVFIFFSIASVSRVMSRYSRGGYSRGRSWNGPPPCTGCGFCKGLDEKEGNYARKTCTEFKAVKRAATGSSYLKLALDPTEERGFAAAGVMLFKRSNGDLEFLMAREFRNGGDQLNFLGGKRNLMQALPLDVAVKKLDMETGGALRRTTVRQVRAPGGCPLVLWSPESKYVLFIFELLADSPDADIDVQAMGTFGAKRLEWVTRSELKSERFLKVEVHDFCFMMLRDMEACNVLDNLDRLFDANRVNSTIPATDSQASPAAGSEETVLASTQFDVVSALGTAACAARPEAPPLPPKPSWSQLVALKGQLHRQDIKKLKLRFHPDHLRRFLKRDPSAVEEEMSKKAMQVVNMLFEDNPQESEAAGVATISELSVLIRKSAGGADEDSSDVCCLEELLAEIKISPKQPPRR